MRDPFSMSDWRRRYVLMAENEKEQTTQETKQEPETIKDVIEPTPEFYKGETKQEYELLGLYERYTKKK